MLGLLRASRALAHVTAIAVIVAALAGPSGLGHAAEDAACAPASSAHDPAAHRIVGTELDTRAADQHCYICHVLRSLRSPGAIHYRLGVDADRAAALLGGDAIAAHQLAVSPFTSRGPPA